MFQRPTKNRETQNSTRKDRKKIQVEGGGKSLVSKIYNTNKNEFPVLTRDDSLFSKKFDEPHKSNQIGNTNILGNQQKNGYFPAVGNNTNLFSLQHCHDVVG
jgi:hypothetical protein